MRIAMFSQWWPPEPAAVVGSLGRELASRGHQVDVVTGFPNYPTGKLYPGHRIRWRAIEEPDGQDGARVVRVPLFPSHDANAVRRAANYLSFGVAASTIGIASLRQADVAYVYHPPITAAWPARLQRRLRGVPFILHIQDLWPESVTHAGMLGEGRKSDAVERVLNRACLAAYRAAEHIVVISPGFKRILVERGVPSDRISVVYNWVDESIHYEVPADPATRARLGPRDRRIVLYAGNMGNYQGLDAAVRAAASLDAALGLDLVLMGSGLARPELERLVDELGSPRVRLLPAVNPSESRLYLASADAHLISLIDLPFFASTIPGKTQVAMAHGRPAVIGVRGDTADLVRSARAGVIAEPSEAGFHQAFSELAALEPADLIGLGTNGRAFYDEHLAIGRAAGELETILAKVAGGRR